MDMAALKQKYITIRQGPTEPFLQFVEKISAALEKQVEDAVLRQMLCKQLVKDNANEDCQKIIQALPGDPSVPDMVAACSKVGTLVHTVTTIVNAMRNSGKCSGCGSEGHIMVTSPHKTSPGKQPVHHSLEITCKKCGKSGHFAKQCHSKFHANGQPLQENHKMSVRGRARRTNPLPTAGQFLSANNCQLRQLA